MLVGSCRSSSVPSWFSLLASDEQEPADNGRKIALKNVSVAARGAPFHAPLRRAKSSEPMTALGPSEGTNRGHTFRNYTALIPAVDCIEGCHADARDPSPWSPRGTEQR